MLLSFELKVTKVGSFGGHWSGENKRYVQVKNLKDEQVRNILGNEKSKPFPHRNDEGWEYDIVVSKISSVEKKQLRQHFTNGFCGQEKLIDNIIENQSCDQE